MRRGSWGWAALVTAVAVAGVGSLRAVPARASTPVTPVASGMPSGYDMVASDGGVFNFGLGYYGSTGGLRLTQPVVGMALTRDGGGYWLVASDGGVFSFGDATFHGSTGGVHLNQPIVSIASDPLTGGYWLVASDGGIFSFDAPFYGSTGGVHLTRPIVGMAPTTDGKGYWLVASDGGVFSFGDATYHGSTGGVHLTEPVVGMAADGATGGYWLVASDGGIFGFDAPFFGSTGGKALSRPVIGMAATGDSRGYWLAASDGGAFDFGDATFRGSAASHPLTAPVVGVAGPGLLAPCSGAQVRGDSYSPACMHFRGDNGGAPSTGVTRNAITVSYRLTSDTEYGQAFAQLAGARIEDTNTQTEQTIQALVKYFNSHFSFYGRQIRLVSYNGSGSPESELQGLGASQADADAATVARSIHAFADLSAASALYSDALVAHHVIALGDPNLPLSWHQQSSPYAWSAFTDSDWMARATADYALAKLCGGNATLAGGTLQNQPRTLALVYPGNEAYSEAASIIKTTLDDQGCPVAPFVYQFDLGTESVQAANLVAKLKAAPYSTVICACDPVFPVYFTGQAANKSYLPEFVPTGIGFIDRDSVGQLYDQQAYAHAFGLTSASAPVPVAQTPGYRAYKSVDPAGTPAAGVNDIFLQLEQLAIGIQMAGPHLTPATFQQGLFAYPAHSGSAGTWQFSRNQFSLPNDIREECWSTTAVSLSDGKAGAYVGTSNQRWPLAHIPKGPPGCPS